MDKSGDLYDKNDLLMLDFGYSYDGVGCKRIIDLLNELNDENEELKQFKDKSFDWIDKEIIRYEEVLEELGKQGVDGRAMRFYTKMLKILRNELQMK